jgi:hypothetical protein
VAKIGNYRPLCECMPDIRDVGLLSLCSNLRRLQFRRWHTELINIRKDREAFRENLVEMVGMMTNDRVAFLYSISFVFL